MTTTPRPSREIDGKGRTVRELLAGRKYSIDYYQREYKWQQKQVAELIEESGLLFRLRAGFRKADLDARQALYQKLAERTWSPERLAQEAAS